jgi:hypothetical protein
MHSYNVDIENPSTPLPNWKALALILISYNECGDVGNVQGFLLQTMYGPSSTFYKSILEQLTYLPVKGCRMAQPYIMAIPYRNINVSARPCGNWPAP